MANLKEQEKWEDGVYQIEENDPVLGGENGITNKPIKQLANRTLWLKKILEALGKKATPKDLTAESTSIIDETGHSHKLPQGSTVQKGIWQATSDTGLDSESLVLTAKAGKKLAQLISAVQVSLGNYISNNKKSDAVNSSSSDAIATSKAVKTAYDKGVEAKNAADNANNNANGRVPINGDCEITGTKSFSYQIRVKTNEQNVNKYARFGQNSNDTFIQNAYSNKYLQLKNDGALKYDDKPVFVRGLQNPTWNDIEQKPDLVARDGNYADLSVKDEGYSGLTINRTGNKGNWRSRIEALPDKRWKFWVENSHDIYLPVKSGTVALTNDLPTDYVKRIGNPHNIQLSWQGNGLNLRVDNIDFGVIALERNINTHHVAVLTGTIKHGATIPLPSGFSERQCKWIVTPHTAYDDVSGSDIHYFSCHAIGTRVVTCLIEGKVSSQSEATYLIIGVK